MNGIIYYLSFDISYLVIKALGLPKKWTKMTNVK